MFPTYKWVLGPYGRAFLYVAKRWQSGVPLEQTSAGRQVINFAQAPYLRDLAYVADARRFDMGERDHFISLEMAAIGMEMIAAWGVAAIAERLRMLTGRLADQLRTATVRFPDARMRAPHVLSLGFPDGMPSRLASGSPHRRYSPHRALDGYASARTCITTRRTWTDLPRSSGGKLAHSRYMARESWKVLSTGFSGR